MTTGHNAARAGITVCVCTYRRPALLGELLAALAVQRVPGLTVDVVVADNDSGQSARPVVEAFRERSSLPVTYVVEPVQNIARVRNRALAAATGEFVALIDDDEIPCADWLAHLHRTCETRQVAGVLAPVLPRFETPPAAWIVAGGFYQRPRHPTGYAVPLSETRTGNALLRRSVIREMDEPFDPRFATGGEDVDFFRRAMAAGHRFVWCDEATVEEVVPTTRATRGFLLRRALLRGRNSLLQRERRPRKIATSLVALPIYTMMLPALAVVSHAAFMKYLIRWCDHAGRLAAAVGLSLVTQRDA